MFVKKEVNCSICGSILLRVVWNYAKARPISAFYCDNTCKGEAQRRERESLGFTKEWLESEYLDKKKSANQIAREIGRDPKRVWEWIRDYGIGTRSRGTDYGNAFKKGQESAFKGMKHTEETKAEIKRISIKQGRKPYMKDGVHWLKHDGAVSPMWKGGITPERQSFYSSPEWVDAVKKVWERDNAICQRCGIHHNTAKARGTFHIHHIISFMVKEKRADVDNLILLCKKCHLWVHSKNNINKQLIGEMI